jgi:hypothetical protein
MPGFVSLPSSVVSLVDTRVSRIALGVRGSVLLGGASSSALVFLEDSRPNLIALLLCSFSPSSQERNRK